MRDDVVHVCEVPDVDFISGVFALLYSHLDLFCGECYVGCLQFECVPIYVSVCFMIDCVGELFVECYLCGKSECFLFESYGVVLGCGGVLLASLCIVFVIPVCV